MNLIEQRLKEQAAATIQAGIVGRQARDDKAALEAADKALEASFIILLKPSMHISLLIESFLIAIACLYSYHLSIHDTKISNK